MPQRGKRLSSESELKATHVTLPITKPKLPLSEKGMLVDSCYKVTCTDSPSIYHAYITGLSMLKQSLVKGSAQHEALGPPACIGWV